MLFLCISHREEFGECSPAAAFSRHFIPYQLCLLVSLRTLDVSSRKILSLVCVSPQSVPLKDHQGTANSGSSARCNVANPDPTLSFDGTQLAVNPSVHRAVPKACQLAETKPFVGLLNPTDGEVDSK